MVDPVDFRTLRGEVESATILPEFAAVARRARRIRRRGRLVTLTGLLAVLLVSAPVGYLAIQQRPATTNPVGLEDSTLETASPMMIGPPPTGRLVVSVVAVAGVDLDHAYALLDVCHGIACDLQLSAVRPAGAPAGKPERTGLLRRDPMSWLVSPELQAFTDQLVLVSGDTRDGRQYQQVDVSGGRSGVPSATSAPPATGRQLAQLSQDAPLSSFDLATGRMQALASQPALDSPQVVPGIAPEHGMWALGAVPGHDQLAVAVSRDGGTQWTVRPLGLPAGGTRAVFASYDGHSGYLLARQRGGAFALLRTDDGGLTWQRLPGVLPWPQPVALNAAFGLVVRPDGTLLGWLGDGLATTYLTSADQGQHFTLAAPGPTGPTGPVFQLSNGYVSTGSAPKLSRDAASWIPAVIPGLPG